MIIRWLQSIVGTKRSQNGHYPEPINTHSLIDVAHEVLSKEALEKKNALKDFEKYIQNETFTPKFIPKDTYSSNASFEFFPNFVKIIFFDTSVAVIIESPTVAKAMRQIFEMLWSRLGTEYDKSKIIVGGKPK